MASDKYIVDHGGHVSHKGYVYYLTEIEGRVCYWAKHSNGIDAVGPFNSFAACKRAIEKEQPQPNSK